MEVTDTQARYRNSNHIVLLQLIEGSHLTKYYIVANSGGLDMKSPRDEQKAGRGTLFNDGLWLPCAQYQRNFIRRSLSTAHIGPFGPFMTSPTRAKA